MDSKRLDPRYPKPWQKWAFFFFIGLLFATLLALTGCSPRIYERVITQRDTLYRVQRDSVSVLQRDSVYVREKGDTIYIYREKVRYRDRVKVDTLYQVRVDSVAVERIKEVQVSKPLSFWQRAKIRAFWWLLGAVLLLLLYVFRKPLLKLIRI